MIVDVSHHHPVKNWPLAKSSSDFLISKATEGTSYVDSTWKAFAEGCEKNGIPFWLFFFIRKGKEVDSVKFGIKTCEPYIKTCKYFVGYAIDCETDLNKVDPNPTGAKASMDYLEKFCLDNGYKSMFYSGWKDYERYASTIKNLGENSAFWEARYNTINTCHRDCDMHQYSSNGKCAFISGGAGDVNVITGFGKPLSWFISRDVQVTTEKKEERVEEYDMNTIRNGSRGNGVKVWQIIVGATPDGVFGAKTDALTRTFQKDNGLVIDGIVGKNTWKVGLESLWKGIL